MRSLLRAMQSRILVGSSAAALLLIAGVLACAPDTITGVPRRQAPTDANRNVVAQEARKLKVCTGDGPPGVYTYQLSNIVLGTGTRGTAITPLGLTFDVPSGTCVNAAGLIYPSLLPEIDPVSSFTVTQIARPASAGFFYVQATELAFQDGTTIPVGYTDVVCLAPANFPCGQDTQKFITNPTIVINEYHGSILSFFHGWASVGDFVWSDTNGNGIQDAGEPGIPGLTVTLTGTTSTGAYSATTVTGANGAYSFTGLPAGTYTVSAATPAGMTAAPVNASGSTPSNDSNGSGATVTLAAGEANTTIDIGFVPPRFVLGDRVWSDTNGDGVQDAGESGINGLTVTISGPGGFTGTTVTAGDGIYAFNDLLAGTYTVCTTTGLPAGYTPTYDLDGVGTPNCTSVTVGPSTTTVDFGYKPPRFAVGDRVWDDVNGNGVQDAGEAGLTGVTVTIGGAGGYSATTTTGADGIYGFSDLLAGTYTVCTSTGLPAGYTPTYDLDGAGTPNCTTVTISSAGREDVDFGYTPPRFTLGDRVWDDVNGNGVQDAGEAGLNGLTVTISGPGGFTGSTVTAGDGIYAFTNLLPGTYTVCTTTGLPAGYTPTYDLDGVGTPNCAAATVGPSTTTVDFGYMPPHFSVGDRVWNDVNGNGVQNAGEPGLNGVTVTISGPGGYSASTTTAGDGGYTLGNLLAGTYTVCTTAGVSSGYTRTNGTTNCTSVTVGPSTADVDFGYKAPAITASCVAITAVQDVAITPVTVVGSGGNGGPYTYSATGLPAGVTMAANGTISGTPTVSGTFSYTITITDSDGNTGTINCSLTVTPPPRFSVGDRVWNDVNGNGVQDAGEAGLNGVTVTITGPGGYTASTTTAGNGGYTLGNLLAGTYTVCTTAGVPVGYTPTYDLDGTATPNCTSVTVSAVNRTDVDFGYKAPAIAASCVAISAVQGFAITPVTVVGSGGNGGPYTYSAAGLPAGVTMAANGTISGTPTVTGAFSYTVTITDSDGNTGTINCSLTVNPPPATSCVSITAIKGVAITPVTMVGSGGSGGPYTFSATGLPAGLTISTSGTISGTPSVTGTFSYIVTVKDKNGNAGTLNCSVTVGGPPAASCVEITAKQWTAITPVTLVGTGGAGGPYTFSTTGLPAGLTMSTSGTISGTPTVNGTFSYTVTVKDRNGNTGTFNCTVTVAPPAPGYTTYTQGGWGAPPQGNNPGQLLLDDFLKVYTGGSVTIGGNKTLKFTSAAAIMNFLPQGTTAGILTASATNPTTSSGGVFAGQVLALRLSVDFSNAGYKKAGLAALKVQTGKLAGLTVSQVLAMANAVLGGNTGALPVGVSISDLNNVVDLINNNYDNGTTNNGYLAP